LKRQEHVMTTYKRLALTAVAAVAMAGAVS
jgi:hypothetical protein